MDLIHLGADKQGHVEVLAHATSAKFSNMLEMFVLGSSQQCVRIHENVIHPHVHCACVHSSLVKMSTMWVFCTLVDQACLTWAHSPIFISQLAATHPCII